MNRKESLIKALRVALVEAFGESEDAGAIMAELAEMGCLPQIEVRVFDPQPECVQMIDGDAFDREFLRSMMIVPE